jgi:hypothetical protein
MTSASTSSRRTSSDSSTFVVAGTWYSTIGKLTASRALLRCGHTASA